MHLLGGNAGERPPQRLAGVGVRRLRVRVVDPVHHVVDADLVAQRRLDPSEEAGADVAVAGPVLARRQRHALHRVAAEDALDGALDTEPLVVEVEELEVSRDPARPTLLGEHELQRRMALEDAREDQVPQRPVRVPRLLDEVDGAAGLARHETVRRGAAAMVVDRRRRAPRTSPRSARTRMSAAAAPARRAGRPAAGCRR